MTASIFTGLEAFIDAPDPHANYGEELWERQESLHVWSTPQEFDPWTSSMLDYFGQATWWRPAGEEPVLLDDMEPAQLGNLLKWIERNVALLHWAMLKPMWSFYMLLSGEMAIEAMEREIDRAMAADVRHSILARDVAARCLANRRRIAPILESIS